MRELAKKASADEKPYLTKISDILVKIFLWKLNLYKYIQRIDFIKQRTHSGVALKVQILTLQHRRKILDTVKKC